jgi:hypothetical protein
LDKYDGKFVVAIHDGESCVGEYDGEQCVDEYNRDESVDGREYGRELLYGREYRDISVGRGFVAVESRGSECDRRINHLD